MTEPMTVLTEDFVDSHGFGFRAQFTYSTYWTDVVVYEIIAVVEAEGGDKPVFHMKDAANCAEHVESVGEADVYFSGYIKWDGCSEFDFSRPHWCGPRNYKAHFAILRAVYKRAQGLMARGNDDPWVNDDLPDFKARAVV